ncbi:pyridoxal phosphate-dependent aminotransferase [bacterium]|nr:pyridoxal phosphate-dependent aminotransferase [bacterium]
MKRETPISYEIVQECLSQSGVKHIGRASIRELVKLVSQIEAKTGERYVRMEMGVPGLPPAAIGTEAEIEALRQGVAADYTNIEGIPNLKYEVSRFVRLFMNIQVETEQCMLTVGSVMGSFASFMTISRLDPDRQTTLFLDPGFPVHKQQIKALGLKYENFDVYNFRGAKLRAKLEELLRPGHISTILYSNPNNPAWICFTEEELKIIGEVAQAHDVIVIEDLAYFGMDFRQDYSVPGEPPYQPTVANYCSDYILLISSSKMFSYAGQRIGMMVVSDSLFHRTSEQLLGYYTQNQFGRALVFGTLYSLSSGTAHSPQYGLAAILKAVNDGNYRYRDQVLEYGERAKLMKQLFTSNGFTIVYDRDIDRPIADGFYFTYGYPGFSGADLVREMLFYGVSAISLAITGSEREGVRACVSKVGRDQLPDLEKRLRQFHEDHP